MEDLDLLEEKLKQMRILDNFELPPSALELLVKEEETLTAESLEDVVVSKGEAEPTAEAGGKNETNVIASVPEPKNVVRFAPDPNQPKLVRMANLSVVSGHAVNGVAAIHTEIVKDEVFNDFYKVERISMSIFSTILLFLFISVVCTLIGFCWSNFVMSLKKLLTVVA